MNRILEYIFLLNLDYLLRVFWDKNGHKTLFSSVLGYCKHFEHFSLDFQQIYARKSTMPSYDYKLLLDKGFDKDKHFKWISSNEPNAVNFSLIRSCIDIMENLSETTQIVLISDDGDFLPLVSQLPNHYILVIC